MDRERLRSLTGTERLVASEAELNERKLRYFQRSPLSDLQKIENLMLFQSRQHTARFICYLDAFRETSGVAGSIVECGVYFGQGLMTFAKLAASLEPYNHACRIIGFDTFEGASPPTAKDGQAEGAHKVRGGYLAPVEGDLGEASIFSTRTARSGTFRRSSS